MDLMYFFRRPAIDEGMRARLVSEFKDRLPRRSDFPEVMGLSTEYCFYIQVAEPLDETETGKLGWLLSETFEPENFSDKSFLDPPGGGPDDGWPLIVEVGPRLNFTTSWSTNAVSVCRASGIRKIERIERSRRYKLLFREKLSEVLRGGASGTFLSLVHDRMTECLYPERLKGFETGIRPEPVYIVPLMEEGKEALRKINREAGLGLDDWDIDYYYNLFVNEIGRNPTNVECFDLGQSNSEHSRHWFFKGRLIIDGKETGESLLDIIAAPLRSAPSNSVIAFKDNSSAISGYDIETILPERTDSVSPFRLNNLRYHIIFTAETHNFPTGVAPFPGAETGTGGRIRDVHATGRGSLVVAGTAAYCVGNLLIPGYPLPWEDGGFKYPPNLASPLRIEIEASNGSSDYGNKFGEPIIQGYTRSFGLRLPDGERREWIKPIMFTAGVGQIDDRHIEKGGPEPGMLVVKVGGPAYRIGIGGGAASSMIQGENIEELDFSAVQRGDAEMEQKLNRVIRACVERGAENPIVSIHDQGAGGNSNVVKEIVYPAGAKIEIRNVLLGDNTLSVLEIWGAEYQENDALLIRPESHELFSALCEREKVPFSVIGEITGDGYIILHDSADNSTPEQLDLSKVLGQMPEKTFALERLQPELKPLVLPGGVTVGDALERVLRLVSVGSKRFLTSKVDRSVTGLIAQQQCTGPLQLTISDVAVIAQSHFGLTGAAISIGEQPLKGLISPAAMARMSVGEAVTNIVWANVSGLEDIKCSGNWMWAAKLPGEGARLYEAAVALRDVMLDLGIAVDGGKDSLSMAALVQDPNGRSEVVKSPGALVISAYVTSPDISKVITPDIKKPGESRLIYIDLGLGRYRMGGTALAHVYSQVGDEPPDLDSPDILKKAFGAVQELITGGLILSGHDRSDGGLITTLLEMAFAGNCGIEVDIGKEGVEPLRLLFSEELGLVFEYLNVNEDTVTGLLEEREIPFQIIGRTMKGPLVVVGCNGVEVMREEMPPLRALWEETGYRIDRLQADPECIDEERGAVYERKGPDFSLNFSPELTPPEILTRRSKPEVAIVREEGSNSDREMAAAFYQAGFEPWDVTMSDIARGRASLERFRGLAFVGGFSYADVLGSAKGWSGVIRFNSRVRDEFDLFYHRNDTFSLGVCNGCQLMALLGWVPWKGLDDRVQPRFIRNRSGRFESRFSTVGILPSPSVFLKGMEGSVLGVWVAHGEGRAYFPDSAVLEDLLKGSLAPVRFVDDGGGITETYPFNPNGSPTGIAALCSPDGRHLALMPHPERTFLKWQWGWMPGEWKEQLRASPWLRVFQNARAWCEEG
ncbi:phosphoribosylformylglycinamidine synthase [bacterium BMS3Bbin06]|nr:phosphoribosylformylglycinamidine synthase [bacterium BMS3Bbin06]